MRSGLIFILAVLLLACSPGGEIQVSNVWARASVGNAANAAVFMTIESSVPDRLTGASAAVAGRTDLMTMVGGSTMKMDYVKFIDIPARHSVSLNPGGLHVWLAELKQPLRAGDRIPLTLSFQRAGEQQVFVTVIAPSAPPPT